MVEVFIDNFFGFGCLYWIGDMVVVYEDGLIEMVGRIDFQVKINGQCVEFGDFNIILQIYLDVMNFSVVVVEIVGCKVFVVVIVVKRLVLEWLCL